VSGFLLDTNVVSELRRPRPSASVIAFFAATPMSALFLSDVVIAEIRFGIERVLDLSRRAQLTVWLEGIIRPMYAGRIIPLTEHTLLRWRVMLELCRKRGHAMAEPDLMLAATAAEHGLTMATRDVAPFQRLGLDVVDPWTRRGER
jgi:predicted nucleic acid-binding protein